MYDFGFVPSCEGSLSAARRLHICRHFLSISWKLRPGEGLVEAHRAWLMRRPDQVFTLRGRVETAIDRKRGIPNPMHTGLKNHLASCADSKCLPKKSRGLRVKLKIEPNLFRQSGAVKGTRLPKDSLCNPCASYHKSAI